MDLEAYRRSAETFLTELLGTALGVEWHRESYLADVDPGFDSSCYLRAWAFETHLRRHLVARFGETWFETDKAGALLRSLWRDGRQAIALSTAASTDLRFA